MQGIGLPTASLTGQGEPAPKPKPVSLQSGETPPVQCPPDTAGMAKLKKRTIKAPLTPTLLPPIPPMPSSPVSGPVQFQVIVTPPLPTTMVTTVQPGQKRKAVDAGMVKKRKTATVKCPKCGEERTPPTHQQYMGFRYCGKTETTSFDEWRASLKERAKNRKGPQ
ncbi:proline-rich extensin-like protein EPR1 [Pecten maximus]|uniref:proline-rich extensin-like protein EPR1 n=1 Tax=Pecten maximus TaxID=6579 RepID=UPI001458C125|nr:proline-rich extensin-like protein EPR1 [Pecten maximus]XP_033729739.1 proline-rich extensin-like protein EPR1 [Pecten maximus]